MGIRAAMVRSMFALTVFATGCGDSSSGAGQQLQPAPTTAEGFDAQIPPADETATWLKQAVSAELDDQYGSSVKVNDAICVNTSHGSAKCSVIYNDQDDRVRARIVVHYFDGRPTYEVVDEVPDGGG